MEFHREFEKGLIKKYRPYIWSPFIKAIKDYQLINAGDHIAVCISGGKDSFVMAKCFDELKRHNQIPFDLTYLVMNPGYSDEHLQLIKDNAKKLNLNINIFDTPIFDIAKAEDKHPCYLCARMRRGYLYDQASKYGCNKIALAHHFDDVIETTLLNLLYAGSIKTMPPKVKSKNFDNMELIRPMYYIKEQHIINLINFYNLNFINCGCPLSQQSNPGKRAYVKQLIKDLKHEYEDIPKNIFTALNNVKFREEFNSLIESDNKK